MITEKWKRAIQPIHTHTIVHSSAIYYQNLNVIHKSSKKVINDQKCKKKFNT